MQQAKEIFSERLKKIMDEEHITQAELAKKINVTRQSISLYINGERNPDISILKSISEVLYVSSDYLLGLSDYETKDGDMQAFCKEIGLSENAAVMLELLSSDIISSIIENPYFEDIVTKIDDLKRFSTFMIEDIERYGIENNRQSSDHVDLYRYKAVKAFENLLDGFDMRKEHKSEFEEIEKQRLILVSADNAKLDELFHKLHDEKDGNEREKIISEIYNIKRKEY